MTGFDIGLRHVGDGAPALIVAEVGLAHDGSLGMAHSYIDAVAKAGVDAVKFQCHLGDTNDQWRVRADWEQDDNRLKYWKRTGFRLDEWHGLAVHSRDRKIEFLCSPFSVEAVKMMDPLVPAWKVPSGKIRSSGLLLAIGQTGKPVIVSTGMCTVAEAEKVMRWLPKERLAWLQCTSLYPCPPDKVGLAEVEGMSRVPCPTGLSDHSGTIYPGLAAGALGCDILEVHVCFSKEQFGFDVSSSLDMSQLAQLVEGVRFIEKAKTPVDKDELSRELQPMREMFMGVNA